jgi:spermidine/putrescine transport system ATP-binding protein
MVRLGVRPEKIRIAPADTAPVGNGDALVGGVVSDTSFTGVSTQYLVRMPWGQELSVFAQNIGTDAVLAPGTPVTLTWRREHAFVLEATGDDAAGASHEPHHDSVARPVDIAG